jgi:hypothetical protein
MTVSAGRSTKRLLSKVMSSREFAEALSKAVGANKRLQEVRYGTFAEEGAIANAYLRMDTGANILPQSFAEFDSYEVGPYTKGSFVGREPTIVSLSGKKWLQLTGETDEVQWNYWWTDADGKTYFKFNENDSRQILSFTARRINTGKDVYIRQRWKVASDANGTGSEVLFTTDWGVLSDNMIQDTLFTWGNAHPTKKYVRYEMQVWGATGDGTEKAVFNYFMLESVSSTKTEPSKYVGPSPRAGEISQLQLASGTGKNLMQYDQATFSPLGEILDYELDVGGTPTVMGDVRNSPVSNGKAFYPNGTNTWKWAFPYMERHNVPYELKPSKWYILSCDVDSIVSADWPTVSPHEYDAQIRIVLGESGTDLGDDSGTIAEHGVSNVARVGAEEIDSIMHSLGRKKLYIRFQVPEYSPNYMRVDMRTNLVSGNPPVTTADRYIGFANFQLEEVDDITREPRPYTLPDIGEGQQSLQEQEVHPFVWLGKYTTGQSMGSNVTQQVTYNVTVIERGRGAYADLTNNRIAIERKGLWHIHVLLWAGNQGSSVNWDSWVNLVDDVGVSISSWYLPSLRATGGDVGFGGTVQIIRQDNDLCYVQVHVKNQAGANRNIVENDVITVKNMFTATYLGN